MKDSTNRATGKACDNSERSTVPVLGVEQVEQGGTDPGTQAEHGGLKALARGVLQRNTERNKPPQNVFHLHPRKGARVPPAVPPVSCRDCQHFEPDEINPAQGIGTCLKGAAGDPANRDYRQLYPSNPRHCDHFETTPEALAQVCREACDGLTLDAEALRQWLVDQADPEWLRPAAVRRWAALIEKQGFPGHGTVKNPCPESAPTGR
jgi:hypothetical protein